MNHTALRNKENILNKNLFNYIIELPEIKTSSDNACEETILAEGDSEQAESDRRANKLLHRFCRLRMLLIRAA